MTRPTINSVETAAIRAVGPSVLVRIRAGEHYGMGECYPSGPAVAVHHVVKALEEQLVGDDPRDVERLTEKLRRWHLFTGAQGGTVVTAISGIEMALWDLAGKVHGVAAYHLFGGKFRDRIRLYADCHAGTVDAAGHHTGVDDLPDPSTATGRAKFSAAAQQAIDLGFNAVKFDVDDVFGALGTDEWNRSLSNAQIDRMVAQVAAIRDCVGASFDLAIDMHGRFDLPSAIRAAHALEPFNLMWLEEPVPPENLDALAEVRRRTRVPICTGENLYTRFQFRELFAKEAADVVMPDLAKCGGLIEGKRIAAMAEGSYIPFAPHNVSGPIGTIAAAHLCASVSNFTVLEWHAINLDYWADLVTYAGGQIIRQGHIELVDVPGFGFELNEDVAYEHRHTKGGIPFFDRKLVQR